MLHLVKPPVPAQALSMMQRQSREPDTTLSIVLMHGADPPSLPPGARVYRLTDESSTRHPGALIYSDLLDLIFSADQVISW
ncbi:MAG: hypothetical protein HY215_06410 [Candidatus Rokubacteria bacterium]|nr:hypothetical protein [Candidatus Rokubacteria bacterium]